MASQKQIDANRRNARNSAGPKTAAGKAASAQNSTKHGVLSEKSVSSYEDRQAYDRLLHQLAEELRPETALESTLVQRLANLFWRERRLADAEAQTLTKRRNDRMAAFLDETDSYVLLSDQFLIGRYQGMLGRQIRETLSDLRAEQELRINSIERTGKTLLDNEE